MDGMVTQICGRGQSDFLDFIHISYSQYVREEKVRSRKVVNHILRVTYHVKQTLLARCSHAVSTLSEVVLNPL
jgi:hypothetical protein